MKFRSLIWMMFLVPALPVSAQVDSIQGHCTLGGKQAILQGLSSTNYNQGIIPGCSVTVYLTGTTTLATIYSNSTGTPLANPFTAVQLPSPNPGYWIFWAADGQGYDVKLSGGNGNPACTTAPNCYTVPLTYTDLKVGGGGGGGGLTFFSAGSLPPLFTTNVTNPGTTPNLAFNLSNAGANTIFGNFTGSSGPPFFATFICTGLLTCTYDSGTNIWNVNIPSTSTLSVTTMNPIKVNGGNGPVSSGTANITCDPAFCTPSNIEMTPTGLPAGQHMLIYPTGYTLTNNNPRTTVTTNGVTAINNSTVGPALCSLVKWQGVGVCTSGQLTSKYQTSSFPPAGASIAWTFANALESEAPFINPSNITAIYAFSLAGWQGPGSGPSISCSSGGSMGFSAQSPLFNQNVLVPGTSVDTETCTLNFSNSGSQAFPSTFNSGLFGLAVYYTGSAPPVDNNVVVNPPLLLADNMLSLDPTFPQWQWAMTVSQLNTIFPVPAAYPNVQILVSDYNGSGPGTCAGGGSGANALAWAVNPTAASTFTCIPLNSIGGGGSGTVTSVATGTGLTGGPITTTGTISCTDATSSAKGCVQVDGTTITATGGVISAVGGGSVGGSGTAGFYALWSASTTLGNGSLDDGVTLANFVSSSKAFQVVCSTCATQINLTYNSGHAPSGSAGSAVLAPDTTGNLDLSANNGSFLPVAALASGFTSGHCGQPTLSGGIWTIADAGAACGSGGGSSVWSSLTNPTTNLTLSMGTNTSEWDYTDAITGTTPNAHFIFSGNSWNPTTDAGAQNAMNGIATGLVVGSGATQHQANGLWASVQTSSTATNAVGIYATGECVGTGSFCWGSNPLSGSTPGHAATQIGEEVDTNATNSGDTVTGLLINGGWTAQPSTSNALIIDCSGCSGRQYDTGIWIRKARTSQSAILLEASANGPGNTSQVLRFYNTGGTGANQANDIYADGSGNLVLASHSGTAKASNMVLTGAQVIGPNTYSTVNTNFACVSGSEGTIVEISDATVTSWGAIVSTGGGSNKVLARCNGANYVVVSGGTFSGTFNGTVTYTTSQTASSSDAGKVVVMNCSSACSYTLPATQPSSTWVAWVTSQGSTTATIVLGGTDTYNGSTSVPVLNKYRITMMAADSATSTNYIGDVPLIAGSNITLSPASNGLTVTASGGGGSAAPSVTFNVATGAAATPAAPYVIAPLAGTISNNCSFVTLASDGSTDLSFNVKFNGTSVLASVPATVTHGTSAGTISTFALTGGSVAITAGQKWELDISSGTSSWTGSVTCY